MESSTHTSTTSLEEQQQQSSTMNTTEQNITSTNGSNNLVKKSKKSCALADCNDKPVKIIGDCRYCQSKFCSRHRLPEAHACPNLQNCKLDAANRLSNKLLQEKCVASKV